jgi:hypothetical protein
MLKSLLYLQLKIWLSFLISQSDKRGLIFLSLKTTPTVRPYWSLSTGKTLTDEPLGRSTLRRFAASCPLA